jgi:ArsR family transcriptional regulator
MKSDQVVRSLAALAQGTRLAAFRLLVEAGAEGLAAGVIATRLRLPGATASFHLAQLARAGLVKARTEGRFVIYSVDLRRMNEVLSYLTENCCGGLACEVTAKAATPASGNVRRTAALR